MYSSSPFRLTGGAPPQTPLQHYKDTCKALKKAGDQDALNQFILKTGDSIMRFRIEEQTTRPKIVMQYDGWASRMFVDDTSYIRAAASNYFIAADAPLLVRQQYLSKLNFHVPAASQQTGNLETLQTLLNSVTCCDEPDPHMMTDYAVCAECGTKVEGSECFMANFADMHSSPNKSMQVEEAVATSTGDGGSDPNVIPRLTWSNIIGKTRTIVQMISTIQGHKVHPFDMSNWEMYIRKSILPMKAQQRKLLTHQNVWDDLRDQGTNEKKFKDMYKNTPNIWSDITGQDLYDIPEGCVWVILNVIMPRLISFTQTGTNDRRDTKWDLQRSVRMHSSKPTSQHGTAIRNTVIVLRKCMELCGEKQYLPLIIGHHGEQQKAKINDLWRAFCQHNEWQL